jgi:small subunit ribosomal protein S17e
MNGPIPLNTVPSFFPAYGDMNMGRIKTQQIKSKGEDIYTLHSKEYTTDFGKNKTLVSKHATIRSKKLRNVLAGFMTRKAKKVQQSGE